MLHTDARFADQVETAVTRIEQHTDAEIVVVASARSGTYRDAAAIFGAGAALLTLVFLLFSPFVFSPLMIPLELVIIGLVTAWIAHRSPLLLRVLTTSSRRRQQVESAAAAAFHEEAVHATRRRTGILVYLSALEDRVVLIPDLALEARIPGAEFNAIEWGTGRDRRAPRDLDHFLAGLDKVGEVLAQHIPAEDENPNEIENRPRIRP